jgi:hypothetical protein
MNASGAKVWTASYDPFGNVHVATGTPAAIRFPPLAHLVDALPGSGPVVPVRIRPPPELDAVQKLGQGLDIRLTAQKGKPNQSPV